MNKLLENIVKQHIFYKINYSNDKNQFEYFRIAIALFSLFSFLLFCLDFQVFLDPNGIINWEVTNAGSFWFEPHLLKICEATYLAPETILYFTSFCYVLCLILLALGVYTRIMALLSLFLFLIFSIQLHPFLYGVELYQNVFLLFLCIFPSGYGISIRPLPMTNSIKLAQQIGIRTIQIYLALTYFSAGFGKAQMASWFNGEFLFLSLIDPSYQLLTFPKNLPIYFYSFSGILVITLETLYAIFILIPFVRSFLIVSIVLMHVFIALFMGLVPFGILLGLVNLVVWYPLLKKDYQVIIQKRMIFIPKFNLSK